MKKLFFSLLLLTSLTFAGLHKGEHFPRLALQDQFGKNASVKDSDRLVLMAFDKETAIAVADFLKKQPKGFLAGHHCSYISDISSMPSFITSMFALPKMKKYPFSILLIKNEAGKQFEKQTAKVTVYRLKHAEVSSIEFKEAKALPALFN